MNYNDLEKQLKDEEEDHPAAETHQNKQEEAAKVLNSLSRCSGDVAQKAASDTENCFNSTSNCYDAALQAAVGSGCIMSADMGH